MKLFGIVGASLLAVAGCAKPQPEYRAPDDGAAVFATSGGSIFGGSSVYVYTDDVAVFSGNDGTPDSLTTRIVPLRPGAFERIRQGALGVLDGTQSVEGPLCADYGFDVIGVINLEGQRQTVSTACPDPAISEGQSAIYALIEAEIVE